MSTNMRELSKASWEAESIEFDAINCGSLMRIADATEKMAASYDQARKERDQYREWYLRRGKELDVQAKRLAALRGVITKLKAKQPNLGESA